MAREDGRARFAFVTFMIRNDSYLPGALMVAYGLRKQATRADLVCLVAPEISDNARWALSQLYDHVLGVEAIFVPHRRRQERQDRPYLFTRLHALRLGRDGDLGLVYDKVVVLDADLLPMRRYDHLFALSPPAGVINEKKEYVMEVGPDGQYVIPPSVYEDGTWMWHDRYDPICPHGQPIPAEITDRVRTDPANMGINASLYVLEPSLSELRDIQRDLERPETLARVGDLYDWPEMQYLTLRWSGQWTNVDLRFSGFNGYPTIDVLFGTHYAGFKPWSFKRAKAMARWARYDDFRLWFQLYEDMVTADHPELPRLRRLKRLLDQVREIDTA
jgi:glycogenin glucosyltransferase